MGERAIGETRALHELKCQRPFFEDVMEGRKPFEFRKNDRNFKCGDRLYLREFLDDRGPEYAYTGREGLVDVTYVLYAGFGLPKGFCIMAVKPATTILDTHAARASLPEHREQNDG